MSPVRFLFPCAAMLCMGFIGCDRNEVQVPKMGKDAKHAQPTMPPANAPQEGGMSAMPPGMGMKPMGQSEKPIVEPDFLKGRWKAVRMAVFDKTHKKETIHVVPLGTDFALPGTDLLVNVNHLLPHFSMDGGVFTSKSDTMENPAAQVEVKQGKQRLFKGWMFMKFPTTHAFEHPTYSLKLTEFVPTK